MKFGRWIPLAEAEAPAGPGILQVRTDVLIDYPRGKSAMVHYDADEQLARALERLRAQKPGAVWVRFASVENPLERLARLIGEFERRFGSPPGSFRKI